MSPDPLVIALVLVGVCLLSAAWVVAAMRVGGERRPRAIVVPPDTFAALRRKAAQRRAEWR